MATGRTIGASYLTDLDKQVMALCAGLSSSMVSAIEDDGGAKDFEQEYAKIHETRDAGLGMGGGKLQRDALCTRGRTGKAPFSNRNFRWHPLIVAEREISHAQTISRIDLEIGEDEKTGSLTFVSNNGNLALPSDMAHEFPERQVILPDHWVPHIDALKKWGNASWTSNSCVISAMEAANWWDAVETYAVLGMSVLINEYNVGFDALYPVITDILSASNIDGKSLPTDKFPLEEDFHNIIACPICRKPFNENLDAFRHSDRPSSWQPGWRTSKKGEGDDASIQIMHVNPLVENEMRHNAENVRYGHRWCNVMMTDHSLDETLDFMEYVLIAHERTNR